MKGCARCAKPSSACSALGVVAGIGVRGLARGASAGAGAVPTTSRGRPRRSRSHRSPVRPRRRAANEPANEPRTTRTPRRRNRRWVEADDGACPATHPVKAKLVERHLPRARRRRTTTARTPTAATSTRRRPRPTASASRSADVRVAEVDRDGPTARRSLAMMRRDDLGGHERVGRDHHQRGLAARARARRPCRRC